MTSGEGPQGLSRVCRWTRVLAFSGAEIPWPTLSNLVDLQASTTSSIEARSDLAIAVNANGAIIDPDSFAKISCQMFVNLANSLRDRPLDIQSSFQE